MTQEYKQYLDLVTDDYSEIAKVPHKILKEHPNLIKIALKQSCLAAGFIPSKFLTPDIILKVIRMKNESNCYQILEVIPKSKLTEEICRVGVKIHPWMLEIIPKSRLTYDLCYDAVKKFPKEFKYVPNKFKDFDMMKLAVMNEDAFSLINSKFLSENENKKLWQYAVRKNVQLLKLMPHEYATPDLCAYVFFKTTKLNKAHSMGYAPKKPPFKDEDE